MSSELTVDDLVDLCDAASVEVDDEGLKALRQALQPHGYSRDELLGAAKLIEGTMNERLETQSRKTKHQVNELHFAILQLHARQSAWWRIRAIVMPPDANPATRKNARLRPAREIVAPVKAVC